VEPELAGDAAASAPGPERNLTGRDSIQRIADFEWNVERRSGADQYLLGHRSGVVRNYPKRSGMDGAGYPAALRIEYRCRRRAGCRQYPGDANRGSAASGG